MKTNIGRILVRFLNSFKKACSYDLILKRAEVLKPERGEMILE